MAFVVVGSKQVDVPEEIFFGVMTQGKGSVLCDYSLLISNISEHENVTH